MAVGDGSSIFDWMPISGPIRAFSGDGGDDDLDNGSLLEGGAKCVVCGHIDVTDGGDCSGCVDVGTGIDKHADETDTL